MNRRFLVISSAGPVALIMAAAAHAQPSPAVYHWVWNPANALVRTEAQVFVDDVLMNGSCFSNPNIPPWPSADCAPPMPVPLFWHWSILPPVPPPAPPPPRATPPLDWDEYAPQPPGAELGTIFVGDYCPCPTSDAQGNPPPPTPPECALNWSMRVAYQSPVGLTFHNMLGHPSLMPEKQVTNSVLATDNYVTGNGNQVVTVRGLRGLIGQVNNQGVRTWEVRYTNMVRNQTTNPPGMDRFVAEGCGTIVTQIPIEITGLTPGVPARFTFDFQTLGEALSLKEVHPWLDSLFMLHHRPDADNAYALTMIKMYVQGYWSTQFIGNVGDVPGFPAGTFPPLAGNEGGVTFLITPTASTYPVVLRLTSRARTHIEDGPIVGVDDALASMKANVWLTVYGPALVPEVNLVPARGPGPAYEFWMGSHEISNSQFVDFLNDAEEDSVDPSGPSEKSAFMAFDAATGDVRTPGANSVLMFSPITSPTPGTGGVMAKIRHRPHLPPGTRYVADSGAENDAVIGVTWVGALKYCNWLTLHVGYSPSQRCYTEGNNLADWHPVTISTAAWAASDLNNAQRADLVANYSGFRLPMDNLGLAQGFISNQVNAYNEWYKASAYDPAAPNAARTGPGGETVPALHWFYGFGRDTIADIDANYTNSGDWFDDGVAPVGYFDGVHALSNGNVTNDTGNPFNLYDLAGNVHEWGQDKGPGFVLGNLTFPGRITRTGSWQSSNIQTAATLRLQGGPGGATTSIGFRVVTTFEPPDAPPPPPYCFGDVKIPHDGLVNIDDLVEVIVHWGPCQQPCTRGMLPTCPGDANLDCVVNIDDLVKVITSWGTCP